MEVDNWRKRDYPARLSPWQSPGGARWYRVLLGPYTSREGAESLAQSLRGRRYIATYLIFEH